MSIKWPDDPSIGNIEADVFDPATWKTEYPNPAFKQMDAADAFWAASIMSRFTDAMIRGVVEEARLTNPEATRYLADVIIKRRDKTVRWGITGTNPLDRFEVRNGGRARADVRQRRGASAPRATDAGVRDPVGAVRQQRRDRRRGSGNSRHG